MLIFRVSNDISDFTIEFLQEGKHFVPVHKNLSNFEQKILWAKENDLHAQEIAKDSSNFASKYLSEEAELCYWYYLLHEYAALQNFVPTEPHKNARPAINYDNIGYYTKWHSDKNAQSAALYKRKNLKHHTLEPFRPPVDNALWAHCRRRVFFIDSKKLCVAPFRFVG